MNPTTKIEHELAAELVAAGINTDVNDRWERAPHRSESERLARDIAAIDYLYCDGSLWLKFGGDGDNGEQLMYILDILFDLYERRQRQAVGNQD